MKRLGVVLAVLVAGCGQMSPIMMPSSTLAPTRSLSLSRDSAQDLVAKANQAYAGLNDCLADITTWSAETPGDQSSVSYGEAHMTFKKAHKERIEITKASDDPKKVGTTIAYLGGDSAQVLLPKPIPVLGRLFTLKLTDKRLLTSRGLRLDQIDLPAMFERLNAKRTTIQPDVRQDTINGRPVNVVSLTGSFKGIDNDVTKEEVALDAETGLPALDTALVNTNPVLKLGITNLKPNQGVSDDQFVLKDRLATR